jgi:hypothetical protein
MSTKLSVTWLYVQWVLEIFTMGRKTVQTSAEEGQKAVCRPQGYNKAHHLYNMSIHLQGAAYELFKKFLAPIRDLDNWKADKTYSNDQWRNDHVSSRCSPPVVVMCPVPVVILPVSCQSKWFCKVRLWGSVTKIMGLSCTPYLCEFDSK